MAIDLGPVATQQEIDLVYELIMTKAKVSGSKEVFLSHDDLSESLVGDPEWKATSSSTEEDKRLVERRNNRIKTRLYKGLVQKGVNNWTAESDGYRFFLSNEVDISIRNKRGNGTNEVEKERINTQTEFDTKFFPPTYFPDLVKDMKARMNIVVSGPKGCGKDRAIEEAAAFLGLESVRIAMGSIADPATLFGTKEIIEKNGASITKYIPGIITEAAMKGKVVILDEFDSVQASVTTALNCVLERGTKIVVQTESGVEIIERHPDFLIVASANTTGHGEGGLLYSGTEAANTATWDRFLSSYRVDYENALEAKIVSQWLPENVVKALYNPKDSASEKAGIIIKIREAIKNGDILDHLSFRMVEVFAQYYNQKGWHKGWYHFILNKMNPEHVPAVIQIIRMRMGEDFVPSLNDYDQEDKTTFIPLLKSKIMSKIQYKGFIPE